MTFVKGKPRPPNAGRRAGTPNKATERARRLIAEGRDRAIVDKITEGAETGDRAFAAMYLKHLRPPRPRETFVTPIPDYAKPASIEAARQAILDLGERLAKGELSIEAHDALVGGLRTYLNDKAAEQQRLLEQYEAERDGIRDPHRPA
jgi:hypothetical protein